MTHADIDDFRSPCHYDTCELSDLEELIRLAHVGLNAESRPTPTTRGDDYALPVDYETPGDEVQKMYFGLPVTYREGHTDPGPF